MTVPSLPSRHCGCWVGVPGIRFTSQAVSAAASAKEKLNSGSDMKKIPHSVPFLTNKLPSQSPYCRSGRRAASQDELEKSHFLFGPLIYCSFILYEKYLLPDECPQHF